MNASDHNEYFSGLVFGMGGVVADADGQGTIPRETRRRGPALEKAILDAGWRELAGAGYAGLTFEAVAERAHTGKAALYRRWPNKESLVLAVLSQRYLNAPATVPDTGALRGDVLAVLRGANRLGDDAPALISVLLGAYFDETNTTPQELRAHLLGDRVDTMALLVERAIARGEVAAPLPRRVLALPMDLVRLQFFMTFQSVPDEDIVDIVDTVFLPLATGTTRAGDAGGAGGPDHTGGAPDPARAWATGRRAGPAAGRP